MNELNQKTLNFLQREDIKQLIRDSEWEKFDNFAFKELNSLDNASIYRFFRNNNISLIDQIDFIPGFYYSFDSSPTIIVPNNIISVHQFAFANSNCIKLILSNNIYTLDVWSFSGFKELDLINIPENVKSIPEGCFYHSIKVSKINLPKKLYEIKQGAFIDTPNLKEITIPSSVQFISASAFDSSSIETIYFEGNEEQWKEVYGEYHQGIEVKFI